MFEKYLNNQCSAEEARMLSQHFGEDHNMETLKDLIAKDLDKEDHQAAGDNLSKIALQEVYQLLHAEIHQEKNKSVKVFKSKLWLSIAAVWLVVMSAIGLNIYYANSKSKPLQQFITHAGERARIKLSDGSQVWLSPQSKIEYPKEFTGAAREVKLTGEAFFDVTSDKEHPFIIQSGALSTKVVGTSFNIKSYTEHESAVVTVLTGKVNVSMKEGSPLNRQVDLEANQRVVFDKNNQLLEKENYPDASRFLNEREGKFQFEGTPVNIVLHEVERQYNVKIRVEGNLSHCKFFGELNTTENITIFLKKLSLVTNAKWRSNNGSYVITATSC